MNRTVKEARFVALVLMCLTVALMIVFVGVLIYVDRQPTYTIREERVGVPPATPRPSPQVDTWTRYDVPLAGDLQHYISDRCEEYGISVPLALAVIEKESGYDAEHVGDSGRSFGLMQVMSSEHTARCIRLGAWNLLEPKSNVRVGIDYLAELMADRNVIEALMAYNAGPGNAADQLAAGIKHTDYTDYVLSRAKEIAGTGEDVPQ